MINTILSDFARVILFPKDDKYKGRMDRLNQELIKKYGKYNFFDYFKLNEELLDYYKSVKNKYSINILTTGDTQDLPIVRNRINSIFENIFVTTDFNLDKTDPKAYVFIAKKLGKKVEEILFIDDLVENIKAAKQVSLHCVLYKNNKSLFRKFAELSIARPKLTS